MPEHVVVPAIAIAMAILPGLFVGGIVGGGAAVALYAIHEQEQAEAAAKDAPASVVAHSPYEEKKSVVFPSPAERKVSFARGFAAQFC